jgi:hypothetical protein
VNAIYQLRLKNVGKRGGKKAASKSAYNSAGTKTTSARRSMAYRTGERTIDPESGEVISFANKKGVCHTELLLPPGPVPDWAKDRWQLCDEVERVEKRVNSRFFKELAGVSSPTAFESR